MIRFGASLCSLPPNSFAAAFYADYILVVKENQGRLDADLKDWFAGCLAENFTQVPHGYPRTVNQGHGRIEIRGWWTLSAAEFLDYVRQRQPWSGLQPVVMGRAERRLTGTHPSAIRYYIASLANNVRRILQGIRQHWGIEHQRHWVLDRAFCEDESRMRKLNRPENFAMVRQVA